MRDSLLTKVVAVVSESYQYLTHRDIKRPALEAFTVCIAVAISLLFLNNPPIYSAKFLGDDLLMWGGHLDGTYASSLQESLRNVGAGKWRPVNTTAMMLVFPVLKDSYKSFYWFSSALVALIMVGFYLTCRAPTGSSQHQRKFLPLLGAVVVGTSPFTFAGRAGVIGFLEFAPIVCCLAAFYLYQSAKRQSSRLLMVYSAIIALIGGLIHERYLAFSLALSLVILVHGRTQARFRGFWLLYLANIGFYVFVSSIVLDLNVLRGGGEVPLSASIGLWIPFRLVFSILHLLGAAGGETVFFSSSNPTQFMFDSGFARNYSLVFPIAFITILLVSVAYGLRQWQQSRRHKVRTTIPSASVEALVIAIALLIPSATVISRIETRWLLGTLVFLCLAVVLSSNLINPVSVALATTFFCVFLVSNVFHRDSYEKFDFWKFRAGQVVNAVKSNAPSSGEWYVAIHVPAYFEEEVSAKATSEASPRDKRGAELSEEREDLRILIWALGYGNDEPFQPLDNPPQGIGFVFDETCDPELPRPCLIVSVKDVGNIPFDLRRFEFQRVNVRWQDPLSAD